MLGVADVVQSTGDGNYYASISWAPTTTGSRTVTAQYLGTTPNAPSSVSTTMDITGPAATTTQWFPVAPAATRTVGTQITLQVTVAPAVGGALPSDATQGGTYGQVQFLDGSTVLGVADLARSSDPLDENYYAWISWVPTTTGSRTVTAQYLGTAPNAPSSVSTTVEVTGSVATTTEWTPVPAATITVGTQQLLQVKVYPTAGGNLACDATQGCTTTSFGKVRFLDGGTVLGEFDVSYDFGTGYVASMYWTPVTLDSRTLTAQYLGTVPNGPSSVTIDVEVSQ